VLACDFSPSRRSIGRSRNLRVPVIHHIELDRRTAELWLAASPRTRRSWFAHKPRDLLAGTMMWRTARPVCHYDNDSVTTATAKFHRRLDLRIPSPPIDHEVVRTPVADAPKQTPNYRTLGSARSETEAWTGLLIRNRRTPAPLARVLGRHYCRALQLPPRPPPVSLQTCRPHYQHQHQAPPRRSACALPSGRSNGSTASGGASSTNNVTPPHRASTATGRRSPRPQSDEWRSHQQVPPPSGRQRRTHSSKAPTTWWGRHRPRS